MRLERLEINGFKSFSDRAELAFDKGVTAIVGPNGCGKSNVADAITWVMGEQSAKSLRGDRMEDLIFSGSDARKPTAAAEVRLRFSGVTKSVTGPAFPELANGIAPGGDVVGPGVHANGNGRANGSGHGYANGHGNGHGNGNGHDAVMEPVGPTAASEAAPSENGQVEALAIEPQASGLMEAAEELIRSVAREVEVTRRLYRSGESEYLIDGEVCRLRDVHELLMDTGLGAKAYAIIEQGKIGMILSSRPTDRRQLIEEAAGVTKYKAKRRSAALKLEAAQQNLTRIDDIVFEVEKQRGVLKRQASKTRRYQKLRDEMRRWEKVLFARKYRQLAETIESARERLAAAREREASAAAKLEELEADFGQVRVELFEAETRATGTREAAHACEMAISRCEQQIAFDQEQERSSTERIAVIAAELETLEARRGPARAQLEARREAAEEAERDRERAAAALAVESAAYETAHREIEGLEADVEAARSQVFSAINAATALRHSLSHAAVARDKVAETLAKLHVEEEDVRIESDRVAADRAAASEALRRAHDALDQTRVARSARECELASARIEHEWRARAVRAREQDVAGLVARLRSLEELEAARAGYGDAPRAVLAQANGKVEQRGAIADYLEVAPGYERAVEACLGDFLEYVVVERPEQAAAGVQLVREERAGRCGFLIVSEAPAGEVDSTQGFEAPEGVVRLSSILQVKGPFAPQIRQAVGESWIAPSYEAAASMAGVCIGPRTQAIATRAGDLFRGSHLVSGGSPAEARGILETKREIKELRGRIEGERSAIDRLAEETSSLEMSIAEATAAMSALGAEQHRLEKSIVGFEAQLQRSVDDAGKLALKSEQLTRERRQAQEERDALDRRQDEARASVVQLDSEQRTADERLTEAQRRLFEARDAAEELHRRAAEAGAAHATLVERASAFAADAQRLEEGLIELDRRSEAFSVELHDGRRKVAVLAAGIVEATSRLNGDLLALGGLKGDVQAAEERLFALRARSDSDEAAIKTARSAYEQVRATVTELDIARATAESDLGHLASVCFETLQATLDEVLSDVAEMESAGEATPDAAVICADEPEDGGDGAGALDEAGMVDVNRAVETAGDVPARDLTDPGAAVLDAERQALSAEEAIAALRNRIERLGPVNMMAIEQHDELESRHVFLSTQRKDLIDSIAQTSEAIVRIDETTRHRFNEAFTAINRNFQQMFGTLFGGGRAGLTLLDENDPLESGIEIVAQPPGKRLQSVQLLSGGEKALTAISLMFGLFKYKPSPFCLLDEIDAPLDDANIGRFVEMLRGMQQHTQFILITHNRKTMEIADRLYGVTMEEPGVSKLISVQLN